MCPKCRGPMIIVEYEGAEIDCGGTWLDADELTWLAKLSGARPGKIREAVDQASGGANRRAVLPAGRLLAELHQSEHESNNKGE